MIVLHFMKMSIVLKVSRSFQISNSIKEFDPSKIKINSFYQSISLYVKSEQMFECVFSKI